jgi:hypothetical protein
MQTPEEKSSHRKLCVKCRERWKHPRHHSYCGKCISEITKLSAEQRKFKLLANQTHLELLRKVYGRRPYG